MSLFDADRNAFKQDYDAQKAKRVAANRAAHAEKQGHAELLRENLILRKTLERERAKLAQVKGVAVNLHSQATRMNGATSQQMLDWADKIIKLINGTKK